MSNPRRDFVKGCLSAGVFSGLSSLKESRAIGTLLDEETAQAINPEFDLNSYNFWSDFLASDAVPIVRASGQTRGAGLTADNELQPVFMHYGPEGFRNAAELDASKLIPEGDVKVSLNTSIIKIATQDLNTFEKLQNAQIRVDVAQKAPILPIIEAMAYTVVSGMVSLRSGSKRSTASSAKAPAKASSSPQSGSTKSPPLGDKSSVQSIGANDDPAWQKMQNIILPQGEGRWALNLEAQKKDSLFFKVFQNVIKEGGLFAPMIGLPGIAMSALQSFNVLYGALHAQPVPIIKSNPLRVFATQKSYEETGTPGSAQGILLQSGTYILVPANRAPATDELKNLTVIQGRVVPPKTSATELDAAAADTLKGITYVTFDVGVSPMTIFTGNVAKPA
jgi:hypothetical protein